MYFNSPYYNNDLTIQPIQPDQMIDKRSLSQQPQKPITSAPVTDNVNIKTGGFRFTVVKDGETTPKQTAIKTDSDEATDAKKKRSGRPKKSVEVGSSMDKKEQTDVPTMYTYQETTDMLRGTLVQIDQLANQVKKELDNVTASRTLKSKYNVMVGLSGNLGDIIGQKITAIKEINNAISKSNEMDYKKEKDRRAAEAGVNDDKYLMDMYNAFIKNPGNMNNRAALGPGSIDATLVGSDIIRSSMEQPQQGFNPDTGYLSYVTNMTPEQKLMAMEDNQNIKQCVVFDAATGNKVFQMIDMSTGQVIPGLPTRDPMFMEDTTIDLRNNIAKNINLNETYPLVVINQNVTNEY